MALWLIRTGQHGEHEQRFLSGNRGWSDGLPDGPAHWGMDGRIPHNGDRPVLPAGAEEGEIAHESAHAAR